MLIVHVGHLPYVIYNHGEVARQHSTATSDGRFEKLPRLKFALCARWVTTNAAMIPVRQGTKRTGFGDLALFVQLTVGVSIVALATGLESMMRELPPSHTQESRIWRGAGKKVQATDVMPAQLRRSEIAVK